MRDDECDKKLKELEERIEALEGLVNLAIEELRDIRALLEKRAERPPPRRRPRRSLGATQYSK
ncbi:MAG: hypothetical protein TU35_006375 [Thermoproteus sp. AZ2]|jgi:hypothetical protein|uniref:Uncharacterized protein n=1 Tax=Thermoproteus sp. AZ2 TaxID=1609232 RepID=A0ACC6V1B7_9CREN